MKDENFRNLIDRINENMEANDQRIEEAGHQPIELNRGSNNVEQSFNDLLDVRRKLEEIALSLEGYGEDHVIVPIMSELDNAIREIHHNLSGVNEGWRDKDSNVPPNANKGDVEVSISGYRAQQDSKGSHQLEVWMDANGGHQIHNRHGDAWTWQVSGIAPEKLEQLVSQWYRGNMKDISVGPSPTPRPMRKVGVNWAYND